MSEPPSTSLLLVGRDPAPVEPGGEFSTPGPCWASSVRLPPLHDTGLLKAGLETETGTVDGLATEQDRTESQHPTGLIRESTSQNLPTPSLLLANHWPIRRPSILHYLPPEEAAVYTWPYRPLASSRDPPSFGTPGIANLCGACDTRLLLPPSVAGSCAARCHAARCSAGGG